MRDEVSYRGPNDQGSLFLTHFGCRWNAVTPQGSSWEVGLAHRRLSILDLTPAGHQPMSYRGKLWITYNGEVYNFIEIRAELMRLGYEFRSSSDTEVILAAYAEWGPECFSRFRGMWGLVIIDCARNEAILSRDRLGIKPLYTWYGSNILAVASEIKQFLHLPTFSPRLDPMAANEYLKTGYETLARTFFQDVKPVRPGSWIRIPLNTLRPLPEEPYWHPERVQVSVTNATEASKLLADKLRECVRIHLRSDVPVGCALSGGLDSSSIAVLANEFRESEHDSLYTFTSTFPGDAIDEREYAEAVVAKVKAKPHFVTPDPNIFLQDLDHFLWIHDEPVGTLAIYASYCVARLTREAGVPVTLNGQGGDEIFSGYWQSYFLYLRDLWRHGRLLKLADHFGGALMGSGNPDLASQVSVMLRRYRARSKPALQIMLRNGAAKNADLPLEEILVLDEQARRVYEIRKMFLPRLLKWDDRNSMAFSVEGRYPFLDHELVELCLSFAPQTLYRHGWTKYPLRLGLKDDLPRKILHRRSKFGFETPQEKWLCGPLRPVLERWLESDRPVWNFVERKSARRMAEQTWRLNGERAESGQALFRAFTFDKWLDLFKVQF